MKLQGDSGSTKTHWIITKNGTTIDTIFTIGLNPYFIDETIVFDTLNQSNLSEYKDDIKEIEFYGAGCSSDTKNQFLKKLFHSYFPNASNIKIDHDIMGACISLFDNKPGIACILGTGSNSCVYDGHSITNNIPALGYVLGDEGGGAYFGKELLKYYIYEMVSPEISDYMTKNFHLTKEVVFENVYKNPLPNRYLASFAPVLYHFKEDKFIKKLLLQGFDDFIRFHILPYANYDKYAIGAVGSIAYYFREELERAMKIYNLTLDIVYKNPLEPK